MQAVTIKSLSKNFGSKPALADVSLKVQPGSIFGFLGPNGAGKTTTIRILMDYIRPTSGRVQILGHDARRDSVELKRRVGYLSSDMQLNLGWTGRDHLRLFESVKGPSPTSHQLVKDLELDLNARVKNLSSGNKQKLAVVLAFAGQPELLIMDEPTRGLDPLLQSQLYDLLHRFRDEGKTVFLSSHNLSEVQRLCDEVALIRHGKVIESRSMADILAMHVHIVTAAFKGKGGDELAALGEVLSRREGEMVLKIKGDINPTIKRLAELDLTDVMVEHANLEDVFLEQYRGK